MIAPAVPELWEQEEASAVDYRTESLQSLRELGPPDLVHLIKQPAKSPNKQFGVYHHVTGVDASSSASLAAYVNTLIYSPSDKANKVTSGTYCCYNAFSRLDMRVHVTIPGSVESYCIDERGEKRVASERLWLETYLCSVLRAYSYADDGTGEQIRKVIGCRRFNPITSTDAEHKFLEAAERLFWDGWQLGSDPEIQVPNNVSNHLTSGLIKYIDTTGRYTSGVNLFEKLRTRDPEVASLLAQVYIMADEEVKAVQLLHESIGQLSMNWPLLDVQAEFCHKKGRNDVALEIAKRSVVAAPTEFRTWSRLAEIYISLEEYDLALLTLNSCPMFTYQDKDAPRPPPAERIQLPVMSETMCDEMDNTVDSDPEAIDPVLRNLVAGGFKGTFQKAYMLLTDITKKIGWNQLLVTRSQVFVMEEEYRHDRQADSQSQVNQAVNGKGGAASPNASSTAVNGKKEEALPKPGHTMTSEAVHEQHEEAQSGGVDPSHTQYTSYRHKRLCERWLENLIMVLYEDLRILTIWLSEAAEYRRENVPYRKTAEEWEVLADLARRLHFERESFEASQQCLGIKFSTKAMEGVRKSWERDGNVRDIVGALVRQICWQYRWYSEFCPPLVKTVRRLIEEEGAVKVNNLIQAAGLPRPVCDLAKQYADLCAAFRSSGTDG